MKIFQSLFVFYLRKKKKKPCIYNELVGQRGHEKEQINL